MIRFNLIGKKDQQNSMFTSSIYESRDIEKNDSFVVWQLIYLQTSLKNMRLFIIFYYLISSGSFLLSTVSISSFPLFFIEIVCAFCRICCSLSLKSSIGPITCKIVKFLLILFVCYYRLLEFIFTYIYIYIYIYSFLTYKI